MIFVNWLNRLKAWRKDNGERDSIYLWAEATKQYFEGKHMNREHRLPCTCQDMHGQKAIASVVEEIEESETVARLFEQLRNHPLIVGISESTEGACFTLTLSGTVTQSMGGFRTSHTLKVYYGVNGQSRAQALNQANGIINRFQWMMNSLDYSSSEF